MSVELSTCIYCSAAFDMTRGQGDHIIPAALGEFQGDARFRRVCPRCNNRIGRSEQQMLQCGLESVLRDHIKPVGRRSLKRGSGRSHGALGAPGPQATIDHGDHRELVRLDRVDASKVVPLDQLVIHDAEGVEHFVRLFPGMSVADIRDRLRLRGITPKTVWVHAMHSQYGECLELAHAVFPGGTLHSLPDTEPGVHTVRGRTKFTITDHHFRAIAKIAFHYYLVHTRRGMRGDEPGFAAIRHFITHGGNKDLFFHACGREFVMPFRALPGRGCITPPQWCHVLCADETEGAVVVYVQLLVGPGSIPPAYYVTLGPIASPLILPDLVWGHAYQYDASDNSARYAGRVKEVSLTRTSPWAW